MDADVDAAGTEASTVAATGQYRAAIQQLPKRFIPGRLTRSVGKRKAADAMPSSDEDGPESAMSTRASKPIAGLRTTEDEAHEVKKGNEVDEAHDALISLSHAGKAAVALPASRKVEAPIAPPRGAGRLLPASMPPTRVKSTRLPCSCQSK